jgi:hypothetical protein
MPAYLPEALYLYFFALNYLLGFDNADTDLVSFALPDIHKYLLAIFIYFRNPVMRNTESLSCVMEKG